MAGRGETEENQSESVVHRVASLPLIQSAYQMLSLAYQDVRSLHPVVEYFCDVSERGVRAVSGVATLGASPLLKLMEPQIAVVNSAAIRVVNELEVRLPVLDQSADEVASDVCDKVVDSVRDVKDRAVGRAQDVLVRTQTLVRDTYEVTSLAVISIGSLGVSGLVRLGAELVVTQAEDLVDLYLPEEEPGDTQAGGEESSASEETVETAGTGHGLVSRFSLLVSAISTRGVKRLTSSLDQFWELLHTGLNLLSIPSQLMRCFGEAMGAMLFQKVSKEGPKQKVTPKRSKVKEESPLGSGRSSTKRRLLKYSRGGVSILQLMRCFGEAMGAMLFQKVSKEGPKQKVTPKWSKVKEESPLGSGRSSTKRRLLKYSRGGVSILQVTTNDERVVSETGDGRVGVRDQRQQSLDGSFYPSRVLEE